jgi:hypothetical protein
MYCHYTVLVGPKILRSIKYSEELLCNKTSMFLREKCPNMQYYDSDSSGRCLRPLACLEWGFESRRWHRWHGVSCGCFCVVRYRSLRQADHSSIGVLPTAVCPSVIAKPRNEGGPIPLGAVMAWKKYYDVNRRWVR